MNAFTAAFLAVLAAETIGDRSAYSVGALSARFGIRRVLSGALPAFMLKSLAAVLLGGFLKLLPKSVIGVLSATTFLATAILIWRQRVEDADRSNLPTNSRGGVTAGFCAIFFSEWADRGQLMTAMMAGQGSATVVWTAATCAQCTKAIVVSVVGARLGRRVTARRWRVAATGLFVGMALLAALRID
jgi:putative Ca2+/H+ antiporter (TMEM165/GDT1 family)